jgi:hypothetical protein
MAEASSRERVGEQDDAATTPLRRRFTCAQYAAAGSRQLQVCTWRRHDGFTFSNLSRSSDRRERSVSLIFVLYPRENHIQIPSVNPLSRLKLLSDLANRPPITTRHFEIKMDVKGNQTGQDPEELPCMRIYLAAASAHSSASTADPAGRSALPHSLARPSSSRQPKRPSRPSDQPSDPASERPS